ncbi:MAG: hypothetical protein MUE73_02525 [Planctomycetes bacterium]|nr:hypothetical protein [Planctomycetota bacterium]
MRPIALPLLFLVLLAGRATGGSAETAHYRVEVEGDDALAAEAAKVLEAAWPEYAKFFGAEPKLGEGEKLPVFIAATREGFAARLKADGIAPPASGGYYHPGNRTAYLWRQPTIYYSRVLLLHEATHQFHYLARTGNRSLPAYWYVEGLAEYLGRHHWDGERLTLGALPVLSLEDYAARAKEEIEALETPFAAHLGKLDLSRPLSYALVRFLLHSDGGSRREKFEKLMAKLDRGAASGDLLWKALGPPKRVAAELADWLAEDQEPWVPLHIEWEGLGPDRIRGMAPPSIVSLSRVKAEARRLTAALEVPAGGEWRGGLLLHHEGPGDYVTALAASDGALSLMQRSGDRWIRFYAGKCPPPDTAGLLRFTATRVRGEVELVVAGETVGLFPFAGKGLGLAVQGCDLRFREIAWE